MSGQPIEEPVALTRAGTLVSLEARVGRLERQQDNLSVAVNAMAVDVAVTRAKLETLQPALAALSTTIEKAMSEGAKMTGDPTLSPAGRIMLKAIETTSAQSATALLEVSKLKLWVATATGALMVLVAILNLFAPRLREVLGL